MKTIIILFQSQVFEIDEKADPQEEVNTNEGTFNTKKWVKLNFILCNVTNAKDATLHWRHLSIVERM